MHIRCLVDYLEIDGIARPDLLSHYTELTFINEDWQDEVGRGQDSLLEGRPERGSPPVALRPQTEVL